MTISHASNFSSTLTAVDALLAFIDRRREVGVPTGDLSAFETELREHLEAVGCAVTAEELARYDIDLPEVVVEEQSYQRVLRCEDVYQSSFGTLRVERSLYRAEVDDKAISPMELRAGLIEGHWTPMAAKQATFALTHLPGRHAAEMLKRVAMMSPSASSIERIGKSVSAMWEDHRIAWENAIREAEEIPDEAAQIAVSLDGVLVPMKDANGPEKRNAAVKAGKQPSGPAGYREVGCATVSLYDADGKRLLTRRFGRMPQKNKRAVKAWIEGEVRQILAVVPGLRLTKVADGAKDNWTFLSDELPDGAEILDFYHASSHLSAALASAYGEGSGSYRRQYQRLRHKLRWEDDGIERVIRSLRYLQRKHPRREKIETELKFFRRNRHRMAYAQQAGDNGPIGSGVVEAACKTLASMRMKGAGMRWGMDGGQTVLTFRGLIQSERFDPAWERIRQHYVVDAKPPDGILILPRRAS